MKEPYFPAGQEPSQPPLHDSLTKLEAGRRASRKIYRIAMLFLVIGATLSTIGAVSVFSTYGHVIENFDSLGADPTGQTPRYAWCLWAGVPLVMISTALRITASLRGLRRR